MTLSSNTAQTRELGELRNHLKWLDEERRKSARKMAELEQRLAQQGRDLTERDQKIQELEWHVANFAERFERIPENDPNAAAQEQRLQDLEWHLSNLNTQLTRIPNMDEERARLRDEINAAVVAIQQRVQADQAQVEGRLLSEVTALRDGNGRLALQVQTLEETLPASLGIDDHLAPLTKRQDTQAQHLGRLESQYAALQETVGILAAQLRERTVTLAAESQTNLTTMATRFQEHLEALAADHQAKLDALADQYETRTILMAADWQEGLNAVANRSTEISPEFLRFDERLDEIEQKLSGRLNEIDARYGARLGTVEEAWRDPLAQLERRTAELDARLTPLGQSQAELAAGVAMLPELNAVVGGLEQQLAELGQYVAPLEARQAELAAAVEPVPHLSVHLAQLEQRLDEINATIAPLPARQASLVAVMDELPALRAVAEQVPALMVAMDELPALRAVAEQVPALMMAMDELPVLRASVEQVPALQAAVEQIPALSAQTARLEDVVTKLSAVRELVPLFGRLEQELELRQAEEVRLANLISAQEGRFAPLTSGLDDLRETNLTVLSRVSEAERLVEEVRRSSQDFNDNWKPMLAEVSRRVGPLAERLTVLNNTLLKAEASLEALSADQTEMRERLANVSDDAQRGRVESSRQLDAWQTTLDEHKETIERFTQQWLTLSNQYKEARMAVQNFAHWQKQLEQQKREASEMVRVETNRMQSRWDGFLMEVQEKLKNFELDLGQKWQAFELDNEQKWASARRSEQLWREELGAVDELIQKLQQDNRNLIWRVQAAQADAIKKWPRLLLEEVEKAVELNPNRRLIGSAPAARPDMSVVDAIEQGLIKIDYSDDAALDL